MASGRAGHGRYVVALREVGVAGEAQRVDGEVAEAGHHAGRLPVRALEASSLKVTSRT
jgi:hypothetical protein